MDAKKSVALVLGANAGQADLIRYLVQHDWSVTVCAHRPGGTGAKLANAFKLQDVSDVQGVTALAKEIRADLVYSVSSDIAVPAVVEASSALGLPYYFDPALVALLDDKAALRGKLNDAGLSVVPYVRARTIADCAKWSAYPCMVKPADSQGQRGVAKVMSADGLEPALQNAIALSPTGTAIVEGWLDGVEISYNVLVADGCAIVNEVSERLVHGDHLVGVPRGHLIPPVAVDEEVCRQGTELVEAVIALLGIKDGALYFQMKATSQGPRIIEIAPRLDGCHIWRLMKASRNLDFLDLSVRRLLGEDVSAAAKGDDPDGVYELMFQQAPPGTVFDASAFPKPKDAIYHEYRYEDGEPILPINGRLEVVGYYVRKCQE
ncbi:ATP-grasp domain-containing protein [Brevundimonas intermedia]|uniref:ATP-grasp domain-containing protein n=1 Tax=Brevundimonas intermedia TaxID=74315 RepID=A0A4Y9RZA1_9CAUL|nr:ATP-grasp domain-containing protein [Brevundimonas intermedia]TFW13551.1 ATP-grasp domain-containing protein [Brevundimonas intermedia]